MIKKNSKFIIRIIVFLASLFVSIFMFYNTPSGSGYEFYFLVPIIYGFLIVILPYNNFTDFNYAGFFVLNYTMLIKYLILPFLSCLGSYSSWIGIVPYSTSIKSAIFLTIYEMLFLVFENNILYKAVLKNDIKTNINVQPISKKILYLAVITVGFLCFFIFPEAFADYHFILSNNDIANSIKIDFNYSGIISTIFLFARYSLILLIINYFYKKNLEKDKFINVFFAFVPVIVNALFNSNLSRMSMLVPLLTFTVLIFNLFKNSRHVRKIIRIIGVCGIVLICYVSFLKFFGEGRGNTDNVSNIKWWGDTVNMYFSGVKDTAIGLESRDLIEQKFGIFRFGLLLNDAIHNVIGISNLADARNTSTIYYNLTYFGSSISVSSIVPNIIEGCYYFGIILSFIWPCLFVYLGYKFQLLYSKTNVFEYRFILIYASIYCSMILMINSAMIIGSIINMSLLFSILVHFNKKIKI